MHTGGGGEEEGGEEGGGGEGGGGREGGKNKVPLFTNDFTNTQYITTFV